MGFLALHRNVRIRIGVLFVQRLMDTMIATFIAIYLASRVGVVATGALVLLLAAAAMVAMLVGGHLSDGWGRRPVLITGEFAACGFLVLMTVANFAGWGPLAVFFSYALVKFSTSIAMPANDSMIVDVTTPENRKFVFTVNYWAVNLALAGGAMLGGFLYGTHFGLLIAVAAVGMGGALLVTVLFVSETKPETATGEPPAKRSGFGQFVDGYRLVLVDRTFGRLLIAATLGMTLELQMSNYIGVRLADDLPVQRLFPFGDVDGVRMLGLLKAENTVLVVIMALFMHVLLRRMSDRMRLYAGIAMFAGGFAVLAVGHSAWVLLLACLVLTIGELMNVPVKQSLLAELAPEQGRPRYMAAYNLNIRIAQALAAGFISLGAIVSPWGISALYVLMGVVIIIQYRAILARRGTRAEAENPAAA
ncbi:MAG TPA: MFS transporter [Amycolatopsis sp.]|uniref:MFS transporter n=1 Tax=Amycolatopsis sp. TaxID=37632 RepID=UPI002B494BDF|nr:MFS transporter [Amycolatopsis sp.]HKS46138.1 MFS transporter [Amycolatopsis sp.]